jgi:hypothetical protein
VLVTKRLAAHVLWIATGLTVLLPSTADPDLWGHVLFGRTLLQGILPATNGLSYTAAAHPWLNHELLAEAAMAASFGALGSPGLVLLKTLLGLTALALMWRNAHGRSGDILAASVATALGALIMAPGFMVRPQLFTFAFLALTLGLLAASDYRPRGAVWLIPCLAVVWTNTHGGVLAGIGLTGAAVGATFIVRLARGEAARGELACCALFALALAVALFVNPYAARLPRFLITGVTPQVPITEWAAVSWRSVSFPAFKLTLIALVVWMIAARRTGVGETVVLVLTAIAACLHQRHIPLFAIAATPIVAALLVDCWTRLSARADFGPAVRLAPATIAAVAVLQLGFAIAGGVRSRGRVEVDPGVYPVQALRFLAQNGIAGNVALPFSWGEYGLWALPAGSKVAVDGRFTTSYPAPLLEQAWRFMAGQGGWDALLTDYPTDIVVADRFQAPAYLLRDNPEWEYVYSDPVSFIFLRKVPSQAEALARFQRRELRYDTAPLPTEFPAAPPQAVLSSATLARVWTPS